MQRMSGENRRAQILKIAAEEFARTGLHGTSAETRAYSTSMRDVSYKPAMRQVLRR